jgi:HD-like signal output (HDOD) protein
VADEIDSARRSGALRQLVIPPCPQLLVRLREAMAEAEPDLAEVARIAASDVAMAATLITAANGAGWAHAQPARTVGQALDRLGLQETARRMTAFATRQALRADHPQLRGFWDQSAERARALDHLARRLPGMSPDLAHTYGLFCHVGMPVLMQCVRGYGSTLVEAAARQDRGIVATENANHRTDHAVTGALVARTWRLAPEVMTAIRLHHEPDAIDDAGIEPELRTLLAAGLVADHLLARLQRAAPEREWAAHGERALRWLQLGTAELEHWACELDDATANP